MTHPRPTVDRLDVHTHLASERSTWVVVALTSSTGVTGFGECSDGGTDSFIRTGLARLGTHVVGARLDGPRDDLRRTVERLRRDGDPVEALGWSTLWGGIEAAWDDLAAREEGIALSQYLGLPAARPVPLYANINRRWGHAGTPAIAAQAAAAAAAGFRAVKIAPFDPWKGRPDVVPGGLAVLDAVRVALPPDVLVMIDCHLALPRQALPAALRELRARDVYWVEDALDVRDTDGLRRLREQVDVPLAGGEHEWDPAVVSAACSSGALDYWLIDPKHAGGAYGTSVLAECVGSAVLTFHNPSGPIGTLHAAHLAGLPAGPRWLEYAWGESDRAAYLSPAERLTDGELALPDGAGIASGLRVDAERRVTAR